MSLYRMKFNDLVLGDYYGTFWVNDSLVNDDVRDSGFATSLAECLLNIDGTLGTTEWQMFQQAKYNNLRTMLGSYNATQAIRQGGFYPVARPLPTVYSSGTTENVSTSILESLSVPYGNTAYGKTTNDLEQSITRMLPSSPMYFNLMYTSSPTGGYSISIDGYILPSTVLSEGNKFNLDDTIQARPFHIDIGYTPSSEQHPYTWQVRTDYSLITFDLNTRNFYDDKDYEESPIQDTDPWNDDGDTSGDGGGPDSGGADNYDPDSDTNDVPPLPVVTAADTGFVTLYNPSITELKTLANYMWGTLFDISTWKKVMADPMDAILGLSIVPVNVPSAGSQVVTVGNISTGVSLTKASNQFVELDCGSIQFPEKWKAYLDYSPYTKISIYLPYIGSQEIDADLIQATTIGVKYHIDILSGACVAFVTANGSVIMQFSGQCAVSIPVTSQDFTQTIIALGQLVASGIGVVATGGMSAPVQGAAIAGLATAAANTAQNVIASKPTYAKTGNMSGSNGLMGFQKPYLLIERPRKCSPAYQNTYTGYPSYTTRSLGSITGFTQVQDVHLDNIPCNDTERDEILRLLREGVIL